MKTQQFDKTLIIGGFIITALGASIYAPTLRYWFTGWDTLTLIATASPNIAVPLMDGTAFDAIAGYYRPVVSLIYWALRETVGLQPQYYRAVNLVFHLLNLNLVIWLAWLLWRRRAVALAAGAILAIHPMIVENIAPISRGQDIYATTGVLLALIGTQLGIIPLAIGGLLFGLAAKEIGIIALPVMLVWLISRRDWRSVGVIIVAAGLYLAWRGHVLRGVGGYYHSEHSHLSALAYTLIFTFTPVINRVSSVPQLLLLLCAALVGLWAIVDEEIGAIGIVVGLAALAGLLTLTAVNYWYFYAPAALVGLALARAMFSDHRLKASSAWSLAGLMLFASPAFAADNWQTAGPLNRQLMSAIENTTAQTVYLVNAPETFTDWQPGESRNVVYLRGHSATAWLNLHHDPRAVGIKNVATFQRPPTQVRGVEIPIGSSTSYLLLTYNQPITAVSDFSYY